MSCFPSCTYTADAWQYRSAVLSRNGSVSSDQPLASLAGLETLRRGGNAADAVIAMVAVLNILQPMTGGLGGSANFMFYRNSDKKVLSINGCGRTGKAATLAKLHAAGFVRPKDVTDSSCSGLWVPVPGAVAAIFDIHRKFGSGKISMKQLLEPAIKMAQNGVELPYKSANLWRTHVKKLYCSRNARSLLKADGTTPNAGDVFYAPELAQCFKNISDNGPEAFYEGDMARRIVEEVQHSGGVLTLEDMKSHLRDTHLRQITEPLHIDFHGFRLWEMKPNTFGIVALVTANVLKGFNLKVLGHNTAEYIHVVVEALKVAFMECWDFMADPRFISGSLTQLLSEETAARLRRKIDMNRAIVTDKIISGGDTTYMAAVDGEGNGCSFINSVSDLFGSGIIPRDSGYVLNDRAKLMSLNRDSPNAYGPNKLPLNTIIPAILTNAVTGALEAVFGVQGKWMQPQGHIQVLLNMVIFGMDPQAALNQPRFIVGKDKAYADFRNYLNVLSLEQGIDPCVIPILRGKGHEVSQVLLAGADRNKLGKGHVIARATVWDRDAPRGSHPVWWAGADPRSDGAAMGF